MRLLQTFIVWERCAAAAVAPQTNVQQFMLGLRYVSQSNGQVLREEPNRKLNALSPDGSRQRTAAFAACPSPKDEFGAASRVLMLSVYPVFGGPLLVRRLLPTVAA